MERQRTEPGRSRGIATVAISLALAIVSTVGVVRALPEPARLECGGRAMWSGHFAIGPNIGLGAVSPATAALEQPTQPPLMGREPPPAGLVLSSRSGSVCARLEAATKVA